MNSVALAEPALVGREKELETLYSFLSSADAGKGTTVFISGEAGSGKTRLTHEFLSSARQKKDVALLSGWCFGEAAVPYFPFIEAFDTYFSSLREKETTDQTQQPKHQKQVEEQEQEIRQWLAGSRQADRYGRPGSLSTEAWKDQAFAAVTKMLQTISTQKTTILFLEDLHWADSASLALIYYLARSTSSHRVLVLGTFRSEELTADAEGRSHPLAETLRLMRRENLATEIKLAPLSETDVARVAESMVGGTVLSTLSSKLTKESRGNALFVVESLRMLSERKSLVKENNLWSLSVDEIGIPSRFKDVVLRRLGSLKFNQRRILDAASVIGEKFDVELLSNVLNQDNLEVLETLNVIAQSTSLVAVEESFFRFDHAKLQEAIYEEIPLPLRKGYHARIAERLENTSQSGGRLPLSEIAHHYAQAGNTEKAVTNALAAGEDALARWSNAEAIQHFTYVIESISESAKNGEQKSVALEGLGDAYCANSMFKEAIETYEQLADFETGKTKLRAFRKAMDAVYFGRKDPVHMIELVRKATPYASSDRLENARVQFYTFSRSIHEPVPEDRVAEIGNYKAALQVFEEEYSLPDVARSLEAVGAFESLYFSQEKGMGAMERSIAMFKELGDSRGLIRATYYTTLSYNALGLFQEAIEKAKQTTQLGRKLGDHDRIARSCFIGSKILEARGHLEEAITMNLEGVEYFEKTDAPLPRERMSASFVTQYAKLGNLPLAEKHFQELMNMLQLPPQMRYQSIERLGDESPTVTTRDIARAKAILYAATNQWEKADEYFKKALEIAGSVTHHSLFSQLLVRADLVWALKRQGRTEEAEKQAQEIQKIDETVEKRFAHLSIDAGLLAPRNVTAGQEFEMRLDLVNVSRTKGFLAEVENLLPDEFEVVNLVAEKATLDGRSMDMKKQEIGSFQVKTIKTKLKASKTGTFSLSPRVIYNDELGETLSCTSNQVIITVKPARLEYEVLPDRITTGYEELNAMLLGGIPRKYAVALTAPSIDEETLLIRKFLETGAKAGETTFCVTVEPENVKTLAEQYPENFFLFACSPQADATVKSQPNTFKLKGVENLTELDIALTKAFRTLDPAATASRRLCIDIISDVLLQHRTLVTRKWLSSLLPILKLKGFTVLATINPQMHPPEEVQAMLGLFDGEIRVTERETVKGAEKALRVRKLSGQKYRDEELILNREKLEQ